MYRSNTPLEKRRTLRLRLESKHPTHVPSVLERGDLDVPYLGREKFLLSKELTGAQLVQVVRKRLRVESSDALFLLAAGKRLVTPTVTVRELHAAHADPEDGFLYVTYTKERAFG